MISFRFLAGTYLLFAASNVALAHTFERVDPESKSPKNEHILSIVPPTIFSVDPRLQKNVDFWVQIYTHYDSRQGLIHDAKYIDHIYEVITFENAAQAGSKKFLRNIIKKWKDVLMSVHRKQNNPDRMNEEEKRIFEMYADVKEPAKFMNAAHRKRLRFQLGQKDRFREGLHYSGKYLPIMEEIFKREGLPVELTRLPFVESSFNVKARSKVGASGIWQFMRSTGRLFLKISDAVDERNDPIRATEAAAKLLKQNYESLNSWPLAVTAYNHGRKGMMRAVRKVGSEELEDVVNAYKSRSFGFASTNFFTELLAAIEVERNAERYMGKVDRAKPLGTIEIKLPDYIKLKDLATFMKIDFAVLKDLNCGLSESVFSGSRLVPAGYRLRIPNDDALGKEATERVFLAGYLQIPDMYKLKGPGSARTPRRRNR